MDGVVDDIDRTIWVEDAFGTFYGDANLDKAVKFEDFLILSSHFGSEGGWANGDFNGNGIVDFPDFLLLSRSFGDMNSLVPVPEPSSPLLVAILVCMFTGHGAQVAQRPITILVFGSTGPLVLHAVPLRPRPVADDAVLVTGRTVPENRFVRCLATVGFTNRKCNCRRTVRFTMGEYLSRASFRTASNR